MYDRVRIALTFVNGEKTNLYMKRDKDWPETEATEFRILSRYIIMIFSTPKIHDGLHDFIFDPQDSTIAYNVSTVRKIQVFPGLDE